jgi:hypothetical protein
MTLDEVGRRGTDGYDQIGRFVGIKRAEIFDEMNFGLGIGGARCNQRMFLDIKLPARLPVELGSHGPCILVPWSKFATD